MGTHAVSLTVNGTDHELAVESRTLLLTALRDHLDYTGTHLGCETTRCGACTVVVDGTPLKSCNVLAVQADGSEVETIEGVATDGDLDPVQRAFQAEHGLQCGYCTPGMVMTARAFLSDHPDPSRDDIREALEGNLCRCTGYHNIVDAVETAAADLAEEP